MDLLGEKICDKLFGQEHSAQPRSLISKEDINIRQFNAVVKLFNRPWWRRGWIIQEIIGAGRFRENVLLHCGNSKKKWEDVYCAIEGIWSTYLNYVDIESDSSVQGASWKTLIKATSSHSILGHASDLELEDWLKHLKYFETSEPKDKVWIGCLLTQHREPLSGLNLQYQQSLRETYTFIAHHLLHCEGSLRILERCADYLDLPSWVPDWQLSEASALSGAKPERFKAGGPLELCYEVSENSYLHLKGFHIGCATRFPRLRDTSILVPRILDRYAAEIGSTYQLTGEPSMNALVRTMFTDRSEGIHYAWEWLDAKEEGDRLPMPNYQDSKFPGESESYHWPKNQSVLFTAWAMNGRKYFVSADGYIELVPEKAQKAA